MVEGGGLGQAGNTDQKCSTGLVRKWLRGAREAWCKNGSLALGLDVPLAFDLEASRQPLPPARLFRRHLLESNAAVPAATERTPCCHHAGPMQPSLSPAPQSTMKLTNIQIKMVFWVANPLRRYLRHFCTLRPQASQIAIEMVAERPRRPRSTDSSVHEDCSTQTLANSDANPRLVQGAR